MAISKKCWILGSNLVNGIEMLEHSKTIMEGAKLYGVDVETIKERLDIIQHQFHEDKEYFTPEHFKQLNDLIASAKSFLPKEERLPFGALAEDKIDNTLRESDRLITKIKGVMFEAVVTCECGKKE